MDQERLKEISSIKSATQTELKGKEFKTLSTKEKDLLLEAIAKMLGLIA